MEKLSFILTFALLVCAKAGPVPENILDVDKNGRIGTNELFQQLNSLLHQNINNRIKDETLEVGDKIKGDHGKLQIHVDKFEAADGFPVAFHPSNENIVEDLEILAAGGDIENESIYEIKRESAGTTTDIHENYTTTVRNSESSTSLPTTKAKNSDKTAQLLTSKTTETSPTTVKS